MYSDTQKAKMDLCAIGQDQFIDRLKQMYPMVDLKETPLPTCWSQKDKFQDVGLTQNNLRAHYKGKHKYFFRYMVMFLALLSFLELIIYYFC